MATHGVEELDDRGTLRPDGGVHPCAGGQWPVRLQSIRIHLDVDQSRPDHFIHACLGHANARAFRKFFPPEGATIRVPLIEGLLRKQSCPVVWNRAVGKDDFESGRFPGGNEHA